MARRVRGKKRRRKIGKKKVGEKSRARVGYSRSTWPQHGRDSKEILSLSFSCPSFFLALSSLLFQRITPAESTRLIYYSRLARLFHAGPSFSPFVSSSTPLSQSSSWSSSPFPFVRFRAKILFIQRTSSKTFERDECEFVFSM